jgi:hypothetical protein
LGILFFFSFLYTCPNQRNLFSLIVCLIVGFLTIGWIYLLVNILQLSFYCYILGLKIFYTLSFQKCLFAFYLSLLVYKFLMHMLKFCLLLFL